MASSSSRRPASRLSTFLSTMPQPLNIPPGAAGRIQEYSMGTLMEVIRAEGAVLILMEYENIHNLRILKRGNFVMKLMLQTFSTIVVAACMVDDMHWPLARDAPVVRVASRSFLFALPGLLYALWFPPTSTQSTIILLAELFTQFTHYDDFQRVGADLGVSEDQLSFWPKAREQAEPVLRARLGRYGHFTGLSPTAVGSQASERIRAGRMSDATELVMKAFPVGLLNPTHCDIHDLRPHRQNGRTVANGRESYPTVVVFSNIVEALQFIWVISTDQGHLLRAENRPGEVRPSGFKVWCLNRSGLACLLRVLIHAGELPATPANHQIGRLIERTQNGNGNHPGSLSMAAGIGMWQTEEGEASTSGYSQETSISTSDGVLN